MTFTQTFEPVRPLRAPDDASAYAEQVVLDGSWRVHYGDSTSPSRSYWLVPNSQTPWR